jgi:hypothetical protein
MERSIEALDHNLTPKRSSLLSTAAFLDENTVLQTAIIEPVFSRIAQ